MRLRSQATADLSRMDPVSRYQRKEAFDVSKCAPTGYKTLRFLQHKKIGNGSLNIL